MVLNLLLWLVVAPGEGRVGRRMEGRGVRIGPSTLPVVGRVSPGYLSLALDTGLVRRGAWPTVLTHPQLVTLTSALGPKYIRWGNTKQSKGSRHKKKKNQNVNFFQIGLYPP